MIAREPERLRLPLAAGRERLEQHFRVAVIGGGIAGVAAACVLAERGAAVTLIEKEDFLGGRAGAWSDELTCDGTRFQMERGFHAFFRNYYNLRAFLRRIDPELSFLRPLDDYPILGPDGLTESFSGLPSRAPWNIVALTRRTPTIGWRDLLKINGRAALEMLRYDATRTYRQFDDVSARAYLDSLSFPPAAKRMLFDVFSHSFFNPEETMSAGELLMQFHFYFLGNPEGLIFDVVDRPFSTAIWQPFARYLESGGVDLRLGTVAERLERRDGSTTIICGDGRTMTADAAVLALTVPGLQRLVAASHGFDDPDWRRSVDSLDLTLPFAVWRLWSDRPLAEGRAPFVGTTGTGLLDNISLYHLFEDESREWAGRTGGAVVELHAYAVPEEMSEAAIREDLLAGLHTFYPETRDARILEDRFLLRRDCPGFHAGSHARRPGVATPYPDLALAGDFVRLPIPSALMERATAAGFLAANALVAPHGVRSEPIRSVPRRGMFVRRKTVESAQPEALLQ